MIQFSEIIRALQLTIKHNAPAILTGVAVVGTVTTAFLAAQGGVELSRRIEDAEERSDSPIDGRTKLTTKEKAKIAWPLFMPAVGVGALTIACTIGANHVGGRRAAALAGAYSLTEKAFAEYKDKVVEQIGAGKEQKVRDSVAQDQITRDPPSQHKEIMLMESTEVRCYESMTGRYFKTTVEKLNQAQNTFNKQVIDDGYASLNEYWDLIGLPSVTVGEELGWTMDHLLEIHITTTLDPEGKPCLSLGYIHAPQANYYKFR